MRVFLALTDNPLIGAVLPTEVGDDLSGCGQQRHEFAGQNLAVRGHGAKDEGVHDVDKTRCTVLTRPADPGVPWSQVEDRVREADDADEFAVLLIADQVAHAASEAFADGDGPEEGSRVEQLGVTGFRFHRAKPRLHLGDVDFPGGGEVRAEEVEVVVEGSVHGGHDGNALAGVKVTDYGLGKGLGIARELPRQRQ